MSAEARLARILDRQKIEPGAFRKANFSHSDTPQRARLGQNIGHRSTAQAASAVTRFRPSDFERYSA